MQKPAARAASASQKKMWVQGFLETLKILGEINVFSTAPVHKFHQGQPGQRKNHPPTLGKRWKNSYSAIAIPCRP